MYNKINFKDIMLIKVQTLITFTSVSCIMYRTTTVLDGAPRTGRTSMLGVLLIAYRLIALYGSAMCPRIHTFIAERDLQQDCPNGLTPLGG